MQHALADLLDPQRCALVTQEAQVGVLGERAVLRRLADEARAETVPNMARLVRAARAAAVPVIHCLFVQREDRRGKNRTARIFRLIDELGIELTADSPGAAILPELGPEPCDIVLPRIHGVGPMGGTELGPILRNLGVDVIVAVGVSVNLAITSFAMDAVNAGFAFVLPRDAVAGTPRSYADAVIEHTLSMLALVTTTDAVEATWNRGVS